MGWLEDFVAYTGHVETPPRVMYWVGVSTIAGALRRKVWISEQAYQWTPNFYILMVGPPGILKKSTSSGLGMRILRGVEGIDMGPQSATWEQLITHMATKSYAEYTLPGGEVFPASCCTIELSEFGSLFDPTNRPLVDNLTDIWDSKLGTITKETKTNGTDVIVNPYLNIIAGATPEWLDDNFTTKLIGSGFASRVIYVHSDNPGRVAHPSRKMPKDVWDKESRLLQRLKVIAEYAGPYTLTEEAYEWSEKWYHRYRDWLEEECPPADVGLFSRKQTHLMKLAMVISASDGKFPEIGVDELRKAAAVLDDSEDDVRRVFGRVGQSPTSKLAKDIVEVLTKEGEQKRKMLYRKHFFRVVGIGEFTSALDSVKASGMVREYGDLNDPLLKVMG